MDANLVGHIKQTARALCAFLILATALPASAVEHQANQYVPDVLVLVQATGTGKDWISFTYPKVVPKAAAEAHLRAVLAETGWHAENVSISDSGTTEAGERPMTSVEFAASNAVQLDSGGLLVEPFAKAFKDLNEIELLYVTPQSFTFQGLRSFENKYVKIALERGINTYRYSVLIKNRDFKTLELPFLQPTAAAGHADDSKQLGSRSGAFAVALVVILAFVAAITAYLATKRLAQPRNRRRR